MNPAYGITDFVSSLALSINFCFKSLLLLQFLSYHSNFLLEKLGIWNHSVTKSEFQNSTWNSWVFLNTTDYSSFSSYWIILIFFFFFFFFFTRETRHTVLPSNKFRISKFQLEFLEFDKFRIFLKRYLSSVLTGSFCWFFFFLSFFPREKLGTWSNPAILKFCLEFMEFDKLGIS